MKLKSYVNKAVRLLKKAHQVLKLCQRYINLLIVSLQYLIFWVIKPKVKENKIRNKKIKTIKEINHIC
jgi:hypothetical protein